ncbi:MAG: hypothetical protein F4166_02275, partial [Gammaproteobacteria bacterium]|nr:hypothetical protein [Gammaproteobacteria bacterium]
MADVKIRFVPETQEALKAIQDVQDSVNALFQSSQGSSANFAIFDTINDSLTSISLNIENVSDQLSAFETTAFQNLSAELGTVNQTLQEVNQTLQEVASSSIDPDTQGIQSVEEEIMDVIDAAREAVDVIASIEEAVGDDIDEFMSLEFGTHELSEELNEALQTFIEARERARELREELENISDVGYLDNATEQQREYNKAAEEAGEAQREFVRAAKEASESTQQLTDDRVDQIKAIQDSIDSFAVHNTQARRLLGAFRQSSIAVSDFRKALSESNAELSDFIDISYRATRTLEILLNSFQVGLDRIFTLENIQETIDSLGRGSEVLFENIADGIIAVEERWTRLQQVLTTIRAHVGNVFFESETGAAPFIDVRPILNNINDVFTNIRTQTANSFSDLANRVRDIANSVGRVFDFGAFFRRFRGPDFDVGPARRVGQLALPPPVDPFPNAAPTPQDIGRVQQYAMVVQNSTDIVT